jgi:carbon-monoxide dehydrogenase small subunit
VSVQLSLTVNDKAVSANVDERTLLVELIRNQLALTGTHVGCDTAQCGACTVLVDGDAIKACNVLAAQANGRKVTTIEGLAARDGTLHPMQAAFRDCHGLQCGFCTPGMVLSALDLVARHPNADEKTIREELEGNLCRCTGYQNIVRAVKQAPPPWRSRERTWVPTKQVSSANRSAARKTRGSCTGSGQFTDDVVMPRQSYGYFLRSPHAHANIRSIDAEAAKARRVSSRSSPAPT